MCLNDSQTYNYNYANLLTTTLDNAKYFCTGLSLWSSHTWPHSSDLNMSMRLFPKLWWKSLPSLFPSLSAVLSLLSAFLMSEKEGDKSWGCSLQLTSAAGLLPGKWESSRWLECWKCQRSEGSRDTMRLEGKDSAAALNRAANIRRLWCGFCVESCVLDDATSTTITISSFWNIFIILYEGSQQQNLNYYLEKFPSDCCFCLFASFFHFQSPVKFRWFRHKVLNLFIMWWLTSGLWCFRICIFAIQVCHKYENKFKGLVFVTLSSI